MNGNAETVKQQIKGTLILLDEMGRNTSLNLSKEDKALLFKANDSIRELRKSVIQRFEKKGWITKEEAEEFFKCTFIDIEHDVKTHEITIKNI